LMGKIPRVKTSPALNLCSNKVLIIKEDPNRELLCREANLRNRM